MKKTACIIIILSMLFALCGCGGNIRSVKIIDWKPSEIYTDEEIGDAIDVAKDYFRAEFDGCTLTEIGYAGDSYADEFKERAEQYGAEEVIILISSFDVDSTGGDGSLNPNSTYNNWKWILVRENGGMWRHVDHGY